MSNQLVSTRCACHEPTVKWCTVHGQPLKLRDGERVIQQYELDFVLQFIDRDKAAEFAQRMRYLSAGGR